MSRKIVIIPSFASSHFLKCWIPNMMEVLEPNIIIINEGLFPNGPENKGHIDEKFRKKWCHPRYPNCGFDINESQLAIFSNNFDKRKPGESGLRFNPKSYINHLSYSGLSHPNECFLQCMTTFHGFEPELGDLIFPIEPDAFLFEGDKKIINEEISKLKPGEGIQCKWMDFLETQYYTEAINLQNPKFRRFCYCFDTLENYKKAIDGFMSQNYPLLRKTESFFIRHYPWFVFDRWKELRYELIWRSDLQYWKDFEIGLQEIRDRSEKYYRLIKTETMILEYQHLINYPPSKITIRPSRSDEGRYAQSIDIKHPKHIENHPNFVK